jgi:ADP-ribose pyrophosphatase
MSNDDTPADRDFTINERKRVFRGFLSIDDVEFEYLKTDGSMSERQTHQVMERGDSAAMLIYVEDLNEVVLTRQFRVAAVRHDRTGEGWVLELPAGAIEASPKAHPGRPETPLECAQREAFEETGYRVDEARCIATLLPSPGGCSERFHIFYASVPNSARTGKGGGVGNEDIAVVHVQLDRFFHMLAAGEIEDAKLLVAAHWLRNHPPADVPLESGEVCYALAADLEHPWRRRHPRIIGYKTGPIEEMTGIDVWVNAENTDMQMARFFDPGISAQIRYLGAAKHRNGTMYADTIADDLKRKLSGQVAVRPSSVIVTSSGDLRYSHKVKFVLHVACAQHSPGGKIYVDPAQAAEGLRRALLEVENMNWSPWRRAFFTAINSMLVPLIGSGNANADPVEVAQYLVPVAIKHFEKHTPPPVGHFLPGFRKLFFIAYKRSDEKHIKAALERFIKAGTLVPYPPPTAAAQSAPSELTKSAEAVPQPGRPNAQPLPSATPPAA